MSTTAVLTLTLLIGASSSKPALSDQVLAELEAANRARSALAQERSDWESERERLTLLSSTLKHEIEKLRNQAASSRNESASISSSLLELPKLEQQLTTHEHEASNIATQIHTTLDALASHTAPGVIAERLPGQASTALEALRVALIRLEQSEDESDKIRVEIVSARLGKQERSVKLLRVGTSALWWAALDGSQQGVAQVRDGEVWLEVRDGPDDTNILRAIEIAERRRQAEIVNLPVDHLVIAEGSTE